jgi:hypothetical protein
MRLRGWCSDLRAGLLVLPALVACLLVCLLAIVFVLWIRTAPVAMLAPPQARRSGPGGAALQEEAVDVNSNAPFAGEVERNVRENNDSLLRGKLHQTCQFVLGQSSRGQRRVRCTSEAALPRPPPDTAGKCHEPT